jgi:hypothetical protein
MTAHAVSSDADLARVHLIFECLRHNFGKFIGDIGVHLVVLRPWIGGGVDVETCSGAEVVGFVFTLVADSACDMLAPASDIAFPCHTGTCIRIEHCDAFLACTMLEEAFLGAIITSTCKTREVYQQRDFVLGCLRREEQVELHLATSCGGIVSQLEQLAAEAGDGSLSRDRHAVKSIRQTKHKQQ